MPAQRQVRQHQPPSGPPLGGSAERTANRRGELPGLRISTFNRFPGSRCSPWQQYKRRARSDWPAGMETHGQGDSTGKLLRSSGYPETHGSSPNCVSRLLTVSSRMPSLIQVRRKVGDQSFVLCSTLYVNVARRFSGGSMVSGWSLSITEPLIHPVSVMCHSSEKVSHAMLNHFSRCSN